VATRRTEPRLSFDYRRELLAYAVQTDPENVLARTAYVQVQGEQAVDLPAMLADVDRLTTLRDTVENAAKKPSHMRRGYLPVRLRVSHSLTAAGLTNRIARRLTPNDTQGPCKVSYAKLET
jgi:hypothetical protein